jgi:oligopeptide/dipeptide ABC transporter ATP-binding protein
MADEPLLVVEDLKKRYPVSAGGLLGRKGLAVKAVDGVNLRIERGETFGLVGESGCGKTTLGRCILRLEEPTSGKIRFDGQDVLACDARSMRALRREMQVIFQNPYASLDPRQTVGRIIGEPLRVHRVLNRNQLHGQIQRLLEVVGMLPEHLHRYPHEFSGGQRQRVCVARALALNPKLIIADEPVSALDVSIQAQILNLLVELQRRFSLTYIFISHDLGVVRHLCDRVAVMYLGKIVELAPSADLYSRPLHLYTQALLSAVPVANPGLKRKRIRLEGDVPSPINTPSGCAFHPRCFQRRQRCAQSAPAMTQQQDPSHLVACHFPLDV